MSKTEQDLTGEVAPSCLLPLFPAGVRVSRVSLELTPEATDEAIAQTESLLAEVGQSHQYLMGDYANYLRRTQGKKVARAWMERTHAPSVANLAAWVCSRVTPGRRLLARTFGHAEAVAVLPEAEQELWLAKAEEEDWNSRVLRAEIRQRKAVAKDAPPQQPVDKAAASAGEAWEVFDAWHERSEPDFSPEQRAGWNARLFSFVARHLAQLSDEERTAVLAESSLTTATA